MCVSVHTYKCLSHIKLVMHYTDEFLLADSKCAHASQLLYKLKLKCTKCLVNYKLPTVLIWLEAQSLQPVQILNYIIILLFHYEKDVGSFF